MTTATSTVEATAYRFGRYSLEPGEHRLLCDGKPLALGARGFDLLVALVARAGRLVTKNELLELVWPGLVVEENNLQVQISALRKMLGSSALATIPGRGYRFELPVERIADAGAGSGAAPASESPATSPDPVTSAVAPPASVHAVRASTNVPARLPPIFGRAGDVAAIKDLLASHVVVTIAGAGGMGKTRVAQAVAAELAADQAAAWPDGVWWVDLAPVADAALVPGAVARVLGTLLASERPHIETLAAVLAPLRMLLVLDNCEHVADQVAELIDAACDAASGVRILATSQETLKTRDEHVYRLGALALPAGGAPADAWQAGAVQLFAARAQAAAPQFAVTPENLEAIVEICRRLDGIPLAIELAAARVPLLGVEGLRSRLGERFNVLTAGARTVLRRHQTLRATLEWSHGLLTADEQRVFRRLGVFAGSFTLEAAQHVAHDADIDGWAALDHLGALVDKSLVLAEGDPVPRYRLLETTRAYALERLGEAGETAATLRLHAEALLQRLQALEEDVTRGRRQSAHEVAAPELENLRAALDWTASVDDGAELAIALAAYSMRVWHATHQLHEGLERCLGIAPQLHKAISPALLAQYWRTIAGLGMYAPRRDTYEAGKRAIGLYRTLDDPRSLQDALIKTAVMARRFATAEEMGQLVAEAAGLTQPEWPAMQRASLEFARAGWLNRQGRHEEALEAALRQRAIYEESGVHLGVHYAMSNVVWIENQLGRHEIALAHARESIAQLEARGAAAGAGHLWLGVMAAELLLGRTHAGLVAGRTAYALLLREGDEKRTLWGLALAAAQRGALADAARIVGYARAAMEREGVASDRTESTVHEALWSSLRAGLTPEELARYRAEGAAMREDDAVKLALGKVS
jgi:predicted ATPase/DNA-binding winged helix-turn-helix (wHTH) protein